MVTSDYIIQRSATQEMNVHDIAKIGALTLTRIAHNNLCLTTY